MSFNPDRWLSRDAVGANSSGDTTSEKTDLSATTNTAVEAASFVTKSSSRRDTVPSYVPDGPGLWPNIMTFIDGPRRCVGYKLASMELKIGLFSLVREFEFEPVERIRIKKWNL